MASELIIVELLSACQAIWLEHFPALHRRAQWHIVHYLCIKGRAGASVGELHGLVKQVFLLDDATVKERVTELVRGGFCEADLPEAALSARTVVVPTDHLLGLFEVYLSSLGAAMTESAKAAGAAKAAIDRALVLGGLDLLREHWSAALDDVLNQLRLSPARRFEAKRHLLSISHGTVLQIVLEHALALPSEHTASGVLVDRIAARLFQSTGQNFLTTRDHISYLMDTGLLERRRGKSLHVGLSPSTLDTFCHALRTMSAAMAGRMLQAQVQPDLGPVAVGSDDTVRRLVADLVPPAIPPTVYLRVESPSEAPRLIRIDVKKLTVGRSAGCDIVLESPEVSRIHCYIETVAGYLLVGDNASLNGTFINGQRIEAATRLDPGDKLKVGEFCMQHAICEASGDGEAVVDDTLTTGGPQKNITGLSQSAVQHAPRKARRAVR